MAKVTSILLIRNLFDRLKYAFSKYAHLVLLSMVITIASVQIYLSQFDTLSAWKGGGFGMYSEPHPYKYRTIFISNPIGAEIPSDWIRVYPPDEDYLILIDTEQGELWNSLKGHIVESLYFPSVLDVKSCSIILEQIEDSNVHLNLKLDTITIRYIDISLSKDFRNLESEIICTYKIPGIR